MDPEVSPRLAILDPEGDAPAVVRQPQHADRPRRHPRFAFLARPVDPRRLERLAGVTSLIAVSWVAASSRVAGTEAPPEAETRNSPVPTGPAKTMTPVPSPTSTRGGIAEDLGRTTGSVDSLQFDVREEAQRPAVRGPEGIRHTLRRG